MATRKSDYTPIPKVPEEVVPRLTAILTVLSGLKTVTQAARELGLSRNRFQSLMHRSLEALVLQLGQHPAGRPATPAKVAALQAELEQLKRENAKLQSQVGSTERLLEVASGLLQGRIRTMGRRPRTRKTPENRHEGGDDDAERHRRAVLAGALSMRALHVSAVQSARIAGVGVSTLRRWRACDRHGLPLIQRRRAAVDPAARAQTEIRVRRLHGLIGAAALSHGVAGVSRLQVSPASRLAIMSGRSQPGTSVGSIDFSGSESGASNVTQTCRFGSRPLVCTSFSSIAPEKVSQA